MLRLFLHNRLKWKFRKAIRHEKSHLNDLQDAISKAYYDETPELAKIMYKEMNKKYREAREMRKKIQEEIEKDIFL